MISLRRKNPNFSDMIFYDFFIIEFTFFYDEIYDFFHLDFLTFGGKTPSKTKKEHKIHHKKNIKKT